ncbi:hypothetical protein Tco_0220230, partial [Tanacetum coccineum]
VPAVYGGRMMIGGSSREIDHLLEYPIVQGSAHVTYQWSPYVSQIGRREVTVLFNDHGRMLADPERREVTVLFDGHGRMLADPGRREVVVVFDGHGRMLADSGRREVVVVFDGHGRMLADSEMR